MEDYLDADKNRLNLDEVAKAVTKTKRETTKKQNRISLELPVTKKRDTKNKTLDADKCLEEF